MSEGKFCKGGGCTAKLGPDILSRVLSRLPKGIKDPNLLVGYDTSDDAAVYKITQDKAIVQTLDFFPPMVEDPYIFGQIAAANALSDIFAMGAEALTALNIVCFPQDEDLNILGDIMTGGAEKVKEAGALLCGGHSINDTDIKYGLSVTGIVDPHKIYTNVGAKAGDDIILTKPLGTGIVCTAGRVGKASDDDMKEAIKSMTTLNKYAADILKKYTVHACTDVTGFSLAGHLSEMVAEDVSAILYIDNIPYIHGVPEYVDDFYITANGQRNRNHMNGKIDLSGIKFWQEEMIFDPQTSGGLLVSIPHEESDRCIEEMQSLDLPSRIIGNIYKRQDKSIIIKR